MNTATRMGDAFFVDKKKWYFVAFFIMAVSALRGIRYPNLWAYSHYLFNYDFGFVKRGLLGEILHVLNIPYLYTYQFFCLLSFLILLINFVLLGQIVKCFIDRGKPVLTFCALLFVSSMAIVFLAHTVGYFDEIGLLVTLISLKIEGFYKKLLILALLMPFLLLIHETAFVIFYPVLFVSLFFSIKKDAWNQQFPLLIVFSVLLLFLVVLLGHATLDANSAGHMFVNMQTKVGHHLRPDAFDVLDRGLERNVFLMQDVWSQPDFATVFLLSLLVTVPVFASFVLLFVYLLRGEKANGYLIVMCICAALSPLTLHFVAWDMHRWNTLTITTSFLTLYVVLGSIPKDPLFELEARVFPIFVLLVFLNGASSIPLFDSFYVKDYPFSEHVKYIQDVMSGDARLFSVPPR